MYTRSAGGASDASISVTSGLVVEISFASSEEMLVGVDFLFLFFFFSSRRRHTRYWRDWSSDVCSSDLYGEAVEVFEKYLPVSGKRSRAFGQRHLVEIGVDHPVRQHMLHILAHRPHSGTLARSNPLPEAGVSKQLLFPQRGGSLYQRKLEKILPNIVARPLFYISIRARTHEHIMEITVGRLRLVPLHRQLRHGSLRQSRATAGKGTLPATGRPWRALQRTEVHHRLIVHARTPLVHHLLRQCGKQLLPLRRVNRRIDTEETREHPVHIAVYRRIRHPVGERTHRRGSILPHPFQSPHFGISARKNPVHAPCGGMQVACARVITQPLPILHHLILVRGSQRLHIGKPLHETQEIIVPLRHTRLLQDNLRNPDTVRVGRLPPRKLPFMRFIPVDYFFCKHLSAIKVHRSASYRLACQGANLRTKKLKI